MMKKLRNVMLFIILSVTVSSWSQIGSLDTSFDPDDGADFQVNAALPLPDGKIMIAGAFTEYNTVSRKGIARINADGTLDTTFDPGTGIQTISSSTAVVINGMKRLSDGKMIIVGNFSVYNETPIKNIARINPDGSLDTSFTPHATMSGILYSVALQPDGKIIIGGSLIVNNSRCSVARLNTDGSLDTSFTSYLTGFGNSSFTQYALAIQPDGKILAGGSVPTATNVFVKLVRFNTDGTRDTSFTPIIHTSASTPINAQGAVQSLLLLPDGKIIVGGGYQQLFGSTTKYNFTRLNADGTLDATFNSGSGTGSNQLNSVRATALQPDGKIIIAGGFSLYNGTARKGIARINANGTLDNTFVVGTGFNPASISSVTLFEDGDILVAGHFTVYNGTTRNRVAKISTKTINVVSISEGGPFCAGASFTVNYTSMPAETSYNAENIFTAQLSDATGSFANPITIGTLASITDGTISVTVPENTVAGTDYRIRIVSSSPTITGDKNATAIIINKPTAPTGTAVQDFETGQTLADFIIEGQNIIWYDVAIGGTVLPSTHVIEEGVVYYASQTIDECESFDRLEITAGIGLSAESFEMNKLKYYPNPTDQFLNVVYSENISSIVIYNLLGQQVLSLNPNSQTAKVDFATLNSGTYFMKVVSGNESRIIKAIRK